MSEMVTNMSPESGRLTTARGKQPRLWGSVLSWDTATISVPGGDAMRECL